MKQYAALNDTLYFWFASNNTTGSGADGTGQTAKVRLAGASDSAAPVYTATVSLLTDAGYPAGCYEVAIPASAANGFATGSKYGVFCTLAVDSQNPSGFIGSFDLAPVKSDLRQVLGSAVSGVNDFKADVSGLLTAAAYTTPPTVAQVRQEMDANSTKLANLDAAVSSRATTASQTTIINLLQHATYGLAAIQALADLLVDLSKGGRTLEDNAGEISLVVTKRTDPNVEVLRKVLRDKLGANIPAPGDTDVWSEDASSV